jgi:hypothetical protein
MLQEGIEIGGIKRAQSLVPHLTICQDFHRRTPCELGIKNIIANVVPFFIAQDNASRIPALPDLSCNAPP